MDTKENNIIDFGDFLKVKMVVGTIISAEPNKKARKLSYVLKVDFGEFGIKTSSAQLTKNYTPESLIYNQIVAVINFPVKRVAGVKSEILVLAAVCGENGVVLIKPNLKVKNGTAIS